MRFGELLDEALGQPVGITKHDRLTAYLVSKRDFESMLANIEALQDQLWLAKAELARRVLWGPSGSRRSWGI
ncbi:Antitoxin Phd_YefM, type II toxin-antitoxin system [Pseudoduganella namucuonensis]|uniref:Antitoxin n=2 Tax=Pseudoduganella namucuonensis TaxID=1035707 RepID=A0A1I7LXK6_9BURK|nr:Antitoxin Phd_YefM, type II toxin-antitoxin system [Pseudoduganella namucuonensis]